MVSIYVRAFIVQLTNDLCLTLLQYERIVYVCLCVCFYLFEYLFIFKDVLMYLVEHSLVPDENDMNQKVLF